MERIGQRNSNTSIFIKNVMQRDSLYLTDKEEQHFGEPRNSTGNITFYDNVDDYLRINEPVFHTITIFICTVGLVETGVVIWFLAFCIQKVNSVTTYFLNLAVADFGILTFLLAFAICSVSETLQKIPGCFSLLDTPLFYLFFFAYTAALYLLTVVSMERFLMVYFPIWYRSHRPQHTSAIVSSLIWSTSALLSIAIMLLHYVWSSEGAVTMIRIICSGNVLILTLLVVVADVTRYIKISSQKNVPRIQYVKIPLTLICFVFLAIPTSLFYFMDWLGYTPPARSMLICFLLVSLNSTVNSVIHYVIGGQWKRWGWKRTAGCVPKPLKETGNLGAL